MAAARLWEASASSDEELVELVCRGDEQAFQLLYDRYFPRLFGFVSRRVGNPADTEETVQEIFLGVFSNLASYRGDAPFAAWVLGVARRTVASRFKRRQHPTVPLPDEADPDARGPMATLVTTEPTPLEHYECGERLARIARASRRLSSEQRQLFEMHHLHQRPIHEIARALDKSEDAVKSNLYRARRLLLAR